MTSPPSYAMFHPFKHRYQATFLREEGSDAVLKLQKGADTHETRLPRALLPKEVTLGDAFALTLQPESMAKEEAHSTMKQLLEDLIR